MNKPLLTESDHEVIRKMWHTHRTCDIAKVIGKSDRIVRRWGLYHIGEKPEHLSQKKLRFSDEVKLYITEHFPFQHNRDIAAHLGLTTKAVSVWACKHNLKKNESYVYSTKTESRPFDYEKYNLTEEIVNEVRSRYENEGNVEIAQSLGLTKDRVRFIGRRFGLNKTSDCRAKIMVDVGQRKQGIPLNRGNLSEEEIEARKQKRLERMEAERQRKKELKESAKDTKKKHSRSDYSFVPDKNLIKLCRSKYYEPKKSTEPCIGIKCVCFKKCKAMNHGKLQQFCDSPMYTHTNTDMDSKEFFALVYRMRSEQKQYGSIVDRLSKLDLRFQSEVEVDKELERVDRLYEDRGLDKFWINKDGIDKDGIK